MQQDTSPLGQQSAYVDTYDASLLFAISRQEGRGDLALNGAFPFVGEDVWNAYEVSWLHHDGLPQVAIAELRVPCDSTHLVESKSLKLYLNSFANSRFSQAKDVQARIAEDVSQCLQAPVSVVLRPVTQGYSAPREAVCLDALPVAISTYEVAPELLVMATGERQHADEWLCSHLLRSRCPVTGQPDWASVYVHYTGKPIDHASLLRYLVSFRNHQGFHEQLVERIFCDIRRQCAPQSLTVYGRFTRRGGIDINPWRSTSEPHAENWRTVRQ